MLTGKTKIVLVGIAVFLLLQLILYQTAGLSWYKQVYNSVLTKDGTSANEHSSTDEHSSNEDTVVEPVAPKPAISLNKDTNIPAYKKAFQHPKTYEELWIVISRDYIIRRLGYIDLRQDKSATIRLIAMQDKRKIPPKPLFMNIHYTDSKPAACLSTKWDCGGLGGLDNYEVYLVKTDVLNPDQYQSVSHITVSTSNDCSSESGTIPIQTIRPKEYDYNFGVCLHKGIGPDFKPKVLLDYVKMHLAVGAEMITIYIQTGAERVYDVLLPYINRGTVEVLDWKLEPNITNGGSHHYGQTGIITECLWRNIYRVKYLGMNDADEFFIPVQHKSISELMTDIDKAPTATFGFPNFMMRGNEMLPKVAKALSSKSCSKIKNESLPIYYTRSKGCVMRGQYVQKVIFRPEAIYIPWVHHLIKWRRGEYREELIVPEDKGLSYHFRDGWYDRPDTKDRKCSTPDYEATVIERYLKIMTGCDI